MRVCSWSMKRGIFYRICPPIVAPCPASRELWASKCWYRLKVWSCDILHPPPSNNFLSSFRLGFVSKCDWSSLLNPESETQKHRTSSMISTRWIPLYLRFLVPFSKFHTWEERASQRLSFVRHLILDSSFDLQTVQKRPRCRLCLQCADTKASHRTMHTIQYKRGDSSWRAVSNPVSSYSSKPSYRVEPCKHIALFLIMNINQTGPDHNWDSEAFFDLMSGPKENAAVRDFVRLDGCVYCFVQRSYGSIVTHVMHHYFWLCYLGLFRFVMALVWEAGWIKFVTFGCPLSFTRHWFLRPDR